MSPEMQDTLDLVCLAINKQYGKGSVMKFTEVPPFDPDSIIPTGSLALDTALGIGGWPKGRVIEIWGAESTGKSSCCLHAIANAQAQGLNCLFIDAEHALDIRYAESLGVDISKLYISQPFAGEDALNIAFDFIKSGEMGLIIIDSVAALTPRAELEGNIEDHAVGAQARMMSKALRMIVGTAQKTNTTVLFTNQTRSKIGVTYGSPITTSGGNALKFYASVRAKISRTGSVKTTSGEVTANKTKIELVKNKMSPPFKVAEFEILFGKGIDSTGEILDIGTEDNIIEKAGAWYSYNGVRVGQGRENSKSWLNENPEIREKIRQEILSNRGLGE